MGFAGGGLWHKRWDCRALEQRGWGRSQLLGTLVAVNSNQSNLQSLSLVMLVLEATNESCILTHGCYCHSPFC